MSPVAKKVSNIEHRSTRVSSSESRLSPSSSGPVQTRHEIGCLLSGLVGQLASRTLSSEPNDIATGWELVLTQTSLPSPSG
jgi:hypothetical protein